ncbi:unnamed protein product [Ectocarpus sp. CCAP 1310/34]|nr:unnamed protein product [Ectocarpus sp. CCAP 1310/34]
MDSVKNNDNINNTMNCKATENTDNNNNDISMAKCVTNKPSCKRAVEPNPLLYKAAARNLCEYHGVPSMTAGGLEKTMVLLQLRPGRLVAQGLAPKQLLEGKSAAGDADADNTDSSSSSSGSGSEVDPEQADNNQVSDDSNTNSRDGTDIEHDHVATQDSIDIETGASKHPIHAVFVAAGVQLRPRETRPLLRGVVLLTSSPVALEVVATTTTAAVEAWVGLAAPIRMTLPRTAMAAATATAGVLATVITAAGPALPPEHPADRSKNTVGCTCSADLATTTTTTTTAARAKEKKKWR